jgi:hypothetical protein
MTLFVIGLTACVVSLTLVALELSFVVWLLVK